MTVVVRHHTLNPQTDFEVAGQTGPDEWNENHDIFVDTFSYEQLLLGVIDPYTGLVEEIFLGVGFSIDEYGFLQFAGGGDEVPDYLLDAFVAKAFGAI